MKKSLRTLFLCALIVCSIFLLTGCLADDDKESVPPTTTEPPVFYTVQFVVGDTVYNRQTVEAGLFPKAVTPDVEGLQFLYWVDTAGQKIQPETVVLTADAIYTAVGYPQLTVHAPFLFVDTENRLNPQSALTGNDLHYALTALAEESALAYFPVLPSGDEAVTLQTLQDLLVQFYPEETVLSALTGLSQESVTRGEFAGVMCLLLGRGTESTLTLADNAVLPEDLNAATENVSVLLEACMPHKDDPAGITWADYELPAAREPGFYNDEEGWLYYVKEDGFLLRDGYVELLYFGADGRYTSGDGELDAIVAGILKDLIAQHPDMDRFELLYEIHVYCRDSFQYLRRYDHPEFGETGWEAERAKIMFTTGRGNCYNYAATFWALSRGIGYQTRGVSGTCLKDSQPHSWCFLEIDGEDYIFDCEWEMAYRTQQNRYDMDMFMIPSSRWSYWTYVWDENSV